MVTWRVEVLRGINLAVREGELVALLGSNGAGKTTFNHTVCGLVRAWTGQVVFAGEELTKLTSSQDRAVWPYSGARGAKDFSEFERY